jgi:ribonuclease HI
MSVHKLRPYFKAHTIRVLTDQLLHNIFRNRDSSRRISKWAMKLSEYVVNFEKRNAIKSQVLADFVAEWTEPGSATEGAIPDEPWLVHCDGAWRAAGASAAAILTSPSGIKLWYAPRLEFSSEADKCTNNIKEYEAILLGLHKLWAISVQRCILRTESKVVTGQIKKECIAREPTLEKYLSFVRRMEFFSEVSQYNTSTETKTSKLTNSRKPLPATHLYQEMYSYRPCQTHQ